MARGQHIVKNLDWISVGIFLVLAIMGWFNIYSASYNLDHPSMFDSTQEYGKQFIWICTSGVLALVILLFDGDFIKRSAPIVFGVTTLLLVLVLIFGKEVNGAKAWFGFGSFGIQPSEFAKLGTAMMLAYYLSQINIKIEQTSTKVKASAIIAVPALLILLQPDTGTVLVFSAFILVLYREGLSGNILLLGLLAMILAVFSLLLKATTVDFFGTPVGGQYILMIFIVILSVLAFFFIQRFILPRYRKRNYMLLVGTAVGSLLFIGTLDQVFENVLEPHQKIRINILLGLAEDPQGAGYNVKQSKTAIGSGGFSGKGYLDGTLTKYKYVPMQSTDFIFCTIGEEWGFVGTSTVILVFLALMLRIVFIAERQRSTFTRIYGYSVACILFLHVLINVGMTIGLAPVIGIPLPFFSYGGSSLWGFTLLLFILLKLDTERLVVLR
ncbi:rod shape-determining protein RodA [Cryomorphaceae bacterium 1068]|nr:rod shape-determining protein RodA [Cryomorphaceae bacterium 1068]